MRNNLSKNKRRYICALCICLLCSSFHAVPSVQDSILRYFRLILSAPQEKVYLQLDKSLYTSGENIWFKGYLVSAVTHTASDAFSRFILVELVNRKDSVVLSKKVKEEDGLFYGNLKLEGNLPAGDYYLRSYTNWMKNEDPDFFYSRLLHISNPIIRDFTTETEYEALSPEKLRAKILFKRNGTQAGVLKINYTMYSGDQAIGKGKVSTDENGTLNLDVPFTATMKQPRIELVLNDSKYEFNTTLYPHLKATDYQVTFFPEGGDLLAIPNQVVAFKAQGSDGYSLPVSGVIKNQSGEEVAPLSTMCDGMGAFSLSANAGDRFYAEITSEEGVEKRIDLPEVKPTGFKITANRTSGGIAYQILKSEETPWPDTLYVAAHVRGMLRYLQITGEAKQSDFISDEYLWDGITQLLLLDKSGQALSERLVFVKRAQQPVLELDSDRPSYGRREPVKLALGVHDTNGTPLQGNFGISVTSSDLAPLDSLGETVVSDLLLTSDLKGYVEHPGRYFLSSNKRAPAELNLLMLTHGWRRFNCSDLTLTPDTTFRYYVERGINFSGRIKPMMGKPVGIRVVGMAPSVNLMLSATTDAKGIFVMEGADIPDSTQFTLRARSIRNDFPVTITMDPVDELPAHNDKIPYPDGNESEKLTEEALNTARERYFTQGGMQYSNLKEITITGKRQPLKPTDPNFIYSQLADRTYGESFLEGREGMTAWEVMLQIPSVTLSDDGSFLAFSRAPSVMPMLIINDVTYTEPIDYEILHSYSAEEIERIDLIQYNATGLAMLGSRGSSGAFVVTVKTTGTLEARDGNAVPFTPRGYNSSVEFYSPVYNTPTQKASPDPDLRSTLYWNPKLRTDENGSVQIEYYTDDSHSDHQVVLEGITTDGRPARIVKKIKMNF